jgi:hypothetical protein
MKPNSYFLLEQETSRNLHGVGDLMCKLPRLGKMTEGNLQHSFHAFEPFSLRTSFVRKGEAPLFATYY